DPCKYHSIPSKNDTTARNSVHWNFSWACWYLQTSGKKVPASKYQKHDRPFSSASDDRNQASHLPDHSLSARYPTHPYIHPYGNRRTILSALHPKSSERSNTGL